MRALNVAAALSLALVPVTAAVAHEEVFETTMSGPAEAPPNASPGTGFARVTFDLDLITMRVEANFSGLLGTTTASHTHGPTAVAFTGTAGVMTTLPSNTGFPLGVTAGSYDHTYDMTLASSYNAAFITASGGTVSLAFTRLLNAHRDNKAYFNIHTSFAPGGEIRGFFVAVPAPSAAGLIGLLGLAASRRRR